MRGLHILGLCSLLAGCSDSAVAPDGAVPDLFPPDAHQYKLDRGKVTPQDQGATPDQAPPDQGGNLDSLVKQDGGGTLITHQAPVKLTFEGNISGLVGKSGGLVGTRDWEWKAAINFNASHAKCDNTSPPAPPTKGYSGTGMWGTVIDGCHSGLGNDATNSSGKCTNTNLTDDHVLKFRVSIPSTWKLVDLIFYQWSDINYPHDWNEVLVDEGSGPMALKTSSGTVQGQFCESTYTKPSGWVKKNFYLDKYVGKTVTISFHFMDTTVVNKAGWYIDDLEVRKFQ